MTLTYWKQKLMAPCLLLAAATSANAAVMYSFTGSDLAGSALSFTYAASGFVQADTDLIMMDSLDACAAEGSTCNYVQMLSSGAGNADNYPQIDFTDGLGLTSSFYFPMNAFMQTGTHQAVYDFTPATLEVTTIVPEPATMVPVTLAIAAACGLIQRRRRNARS